MVRIDVVGFVVGFDEYEKVESCNQVGNCVQKGWFSKLFYDEVNEGNCYECCCWNYDVGNGEFMGFGVLQVEIDEFGKDELDLEGCVGDDVDGILGCVLYGKSLFVRVD